MCPASVELQKYHIWNGRKLEKTRNMFLGPVMLTLPMELP
jgi:hypothetical protein